MEKNELKNDKSWSALSLAWELGYLIAIPLVVLALLGQFLDKKFGASPLFLLVGIFFSIFITTIGLARKMTRITKEMDNLAKSQESRAKDKEKVTDEI